MEGQYFPVVYEQQVRQHRQAQQHQIVLRFVYQPWGLLQAQENLRSIKQDDKGNECKGYQHKVNSQLAAGHFLVVTGIKVAAIDRSETEHDTFPQHEQDQVDLHGQSSGGHAVDVVLSQHH